MKVLPTIDAIKKRVAYDCETGAFTDVNGAVAGTVRPNGYRYIRVAGDRYAAHRLAWLLHYGVDPDEMQIDHIDGDRDNNRISNLRLATPSENKVNTSTPSGIRRVGKRWRARVRHKGKEYGHTHDCPLLAHVWYIDTRREVFGVFAS